MEALGDRVLSPGMTGREVRTLQRLLGVPQTGTYDALTQYAVGEFQAQNDIPVDGQAGTRTKRLLARRPRPPKNPPTLPPSGTTTPDGRTAPDDQAPADPGSGTQQPGTTTTPPEGSVPAQPPATGSAPQGTQSP
jgi:hypothetical protein